MVKNKFYFYAGMTVEAAFVVPAVLFCWIFVIYMGFYIHDSITAENTAFMLSGHLAKSCLKNIILEKKQVDYGQEWESMLTEQWNDHLAEQEAVIMSEGKALIQEKMLMSHIADIHIKCSYNLFGKSISCSVEVDGNMRLPIKIFGIETADFLSKGSTEITDAIKYLWRRL